MFAANVLCSPFFSTCYRTVAIEAAYQNVGISTSVALTMFRGADLSNALGVPFFYAMTEIVLISTFCIIAWKLGWTKAPRDERFFKVLFISYEVDQRESHKDMKAAGSGTDGDDDDAETSANETATIFTSSDGSADDNV